jgi:hypothetical protein
VISVKTASVHVSHILHKLDAPNLREAAAIAHRVARVIGKPRSHRRARSKGLARRDNLVRGSGGTGAVHVLSYLRSVAPRGAGNLTFSTAASRQRTVHSETYGTAATKKSKPNAMPIAEWPPRASAAPPTNDPAR